ncbi:MAG: GIY-YIG nuclease family protein [Ruminococcaceae bacterium]|nr:GIY-YIG nuclease family protein [Oscillospiraceae bacterium]
MKGLLLKDLLNFSENEIDKVKIKFNQYDGNNDPMELYKNNPEIINTEWLFWNEKRRYFFVGQIAVCFLKLSYDKWLLTTIKRVTKDLGISGGVSFEGEEIEKYKSLFGRVIVQHHKTYMSQGRYFSEIQEDLVVNQILPDVYDGEDFPGYDKVRLSYRQLEVIIKKEKKDWVAALSNQKAVYLITDKKTGKLYVGSATSDNGMLLQRWSNYVWNGHGGNKELVELVRREGFDYIKENFQYAILENYNAKVEDAVILNRESWWKETLQSRKWGYNCN